MKSLFIVFKKTSYIILLTLVFMCWHDVKGQTDNSTSDSVLLKQIEAQMQSAEPPPQVTRSAISANPDIGVVGDFRSSYQRMGNRNVDAYLNETEISLQSVVDPYVRADMFLTFGRDPITHEYGASVEEAYLTTLALPARLQLKVGKFREAVGKINPVHPHALPIIDMPNAYVNYFGEEGLNDEGASLSWLLPNNAVYQEVVFQVTSGAEESPAFYRGDNNRLVYLGHLKNFFTLSDNATLEFGLTGIAGPNDSSRLTRMGALDLTYKWKPVQMNTYRSLAWQSEWFYSNAQYGENQTKESYGYYSFLEYQLAKRWFLTGMYDYAQKPENNKVVEQAGSLTLGWLASEFQKIEVEGKSTSRNVGPDDTQVWLRWIFVIGAHGAHQY